MKASAPDKDEGLATIKNWKQKCAHSLRDSWLPCVNIGQRWYAVQKRWCCTKRRQQRPPNYKVISFLCTCPRSDVRMAAERANWCTENRNSDQNPIGSFGEDVHAGTKFSPGEHWWILLRRKQWWSCVKKICTQKRQFRLDEDPEWQRMTQ